LKNSDTKQEDYTDTKEALVHIETALEHVDKSTKAAVCTVSLVFFLINLIPTDGLWFDYIKCLCSVEIVYCKTNDFGVEIGQDGDV
jgi:hypothetical protein